MNVQFPPAPQIRYLPNGQTFNAGNLQVSLQLNGKTVTWSPGSTANTSLNGNLLGTIRVSDHHIAHNCCPSLGGGRHYSHTHTHTHTQPFGGLEGSGDQKSDTHHS